MTDFTTITLRCDRRDAGELRRVAVEIKRTGTERDVSVRGPAPAHDEEQAEYCLRISGFPEWVGDVASEQTVERAVARSGLSAVEYEISGRSPVSGQATGIEQP